MNDLEPRPIGVCPSCHLLIFPQVEGYIIPANRYSGEQDISFISCPECGYTTGDMDYRLWDIDDNFYPLEDRDYYFVQ